jgi:hypothetical protein
MKTANLPDPAALQTIADFRMVQSLLGVATKDTIATLTLAVAFNRAQSKQLAPDDLVDELFATRAALDRLVKQTREFAEHPADETMRLELIATINEITGQNNE